MIARIMQTTPGYLGTFSIGEMMLFLTTRPRLTWLFLLLTQMKLMSIFASDDNYDLEKIRSKGKPNQWWSSSHVTLYTEVILQVVALYPMGRVAAFAAPRGYLKVWTPEYASLPAGARLMYGSAMLYLTVGALSLSCIMINLLVLWTTPSSQPTTETGNPPEGPPAPAPTPLPCTRCNEIHGESDDDEFFRSMIFSISAANMTIITWMASWLFWAGFVKAASERYGHDHHTIERIHDSS